MGHAPLRALRAADAASERHAPLRALRSADAAQRQRWERGRLLLGAVHFTITSAHPSLGFGAGDFVARFGPRGIVSERLRSARSARSVAQPACCVLAASMASDAAAGADVGAATAPPPPPPPPVPAHVPPPVAVPDAVMRAIYGDRGAEEKRAALDSSLRKCARPSARRDGPRRMFLHICCVAPRCAALCARGGAARARRDVPHPWCKRTSVNVDGAPRPARAAGGLSTRNARTTRKSACAPRGGSRELASCTVDSASDAPRATRHARCRYVADTLLYDKTHLPRTAPAPDCVRQPAKGVPP